MRAQLGTLVYVAVDGTIKHPNSQQDEEEDDEGEEDVALGVEREESGASIQAADAVPAQQGEETDHQCQNPAEHHQAVDPIGLPGWLLGQRFYHGGVALHRNQQQAEDGGCQGHEQHALPEEPQGRGEAEGLVAGHADIDHVGCTSEQIAQGDVSNADVNPAAAVADAGDDGHQHQEVLQDYKHAEKEEKGHGDADGGLGG